MKLIFIDCCRRWRWTLLFAVVIGAMIHFGAVHNPASLFCVLMPLAILGGAAGQGVFNVYALQPLPQGEAMRAVWLWLIAGYGGVSAATLLLLGRSPSAIYLSITQLGVYASLALIMGRINQDAGARGKFLGVLIVPLIMVFFVMNLKQIGLHIREAASGLSISHYVVMATSLAMMTLSWHHSGKILAPTSSGAALKHFEATQKHLKSRRILIPTERGHPTVWQSCLRLLGREALIGLSLAVLAAIILGTVRWIGKYRYLEGASPATLVGHLVPMVMIIGVSASWRFSLRSLRPLPLSTQLLVATVFTVPVALALIVAGLGAAVGLSWLAATGVFLWCFGLSALARVSHCWAETRFAAGIPLASAAAVSTTYPLLPQAWVLGLGAALSTTAWALLLHLLAASAQPYRKTSHAERQLHLLDANRGMR